MPAAPGTDGTVPSSGTDGTVPETALSIRPYRDSDLADVETLWRACDLTVPQNDPARDIAFCVGSADAALFVGERRGRLVATAMTGHDGHRGWIYYLAVDPAERGHGLGRHMMCHVEDWLRRRGVAKLNLMIREHNGAVQAFYEAIGYAAEPRIVMARRLDGGAG